MSRHHFSLCSTCFYPVGQNDGIMIHYPTSKKNNKRLHHKSCFKCLICGVDASKRRMILTANQIMCQKCHNGGSCIWCSPLTKEKLSCNPIRYLEFDRFKFNSHTLQCMKPYQHTADLFYVQ